MQMCDVFIALGPAVFEDLLRHVSIGKLKVFQIYDRFKARAHLAKLNSETLRKAHSKLWARIEAREEDFAADLSQVLLISHLDMIIDVLNLLNIPHQDGFFEKDLKPEQYLSDGWQEKVYDNFQDKYPKSTLLFYINHLDWELTKPEKVFVPAA
jgi:hypothetical protein